MAGRGSAWPGLPLRYPGGHGPDNTPAAGPLFDKDHFVRRRKVNLFSAAFCLAGLSFLPFRLYPHVAWHTALEDAVTICTAPCDLDAAGVNTLAVADSAHPAADLAVLFDNAIPNNPTRRAACAACETAILRAADLDHTGPDAR